MLSEIDINEVFIRSMAVSDLDAAFSLSTAAGWNQSYTDWRRMFLLEPHGCFVAEWHGRVIGTTLCCTFGRIAWLAMVIVDQTFRGQGIGRRLVQTGLDYADRLGVTTVRLDATRLGEAVYRQLNFEPQFELIRMTGVVVPNDTQAQRSEFEISLTDIANTRKISSLLTLDFVATRTDRSKLLRQLFQEWAPVQATSPEGIVAGFLASREGRVSVQFGPCAGHQPAAIALLEHALQSTAGQSVIVDIPADADEMLALAHRFGLTEQRRLLRMCRGAEVLEDRQLYHASYGGEFG